MYETTKTSFQRRVKKREKELKKGTE